MFNRAEHYINFIISIIITGAIGCFCESIISCVFNESFYVLQ